MTEDSADRDEEVMRAAEYALGLLSPDETALFEASLERDSQAREDYARWAEHFAALTAGFPEATPPDAVLARIEERLFPANPATVPSPASFWDRFGLGGAIGGGLLAALAVLWLINLSGIMNWLDTPALVAEITAQDQSLVVDARYDAEARTLAIDRKAGAAAAGRALELWLIVGDAAPVSLGVLPEAETAVVALPETLAAGLEGGVLAISDEPPGGSPTGAPTGAILAVGTLGQL